MAAAKLHLVVGTEKGIASADFRGSNWIGEKDGDNHRTLAEKDPLTDQELAIALEVFPKMNAEMDKLGMQFEGGFPRFGVWDS